MCIVFAGALLYANNFAVDHYNELQNILVQIWPKLQCNLESALPVALLLYLQHVHTKIYKL